MLKKTELPEVAQTFNSNSDIITTLYFYFILENLVPSTYQEKKKTLKFILHPLFDFLSHFLLACFCWIKKWRLKQKLNFRCLLIKFHYLAKTWENCVLEVRREFFWLCTKLRRVRVIHFSMCRKNSCMQTTLNTYALWR